MSFERCAALAAATYAASVVKLVDTLGLGPSGAIHGGSSPSARTINKSQLLSISVTTQKSCR